MKRVVIASLALVAIFAVALFTLAPRGTPPITPTRSKLSNWNLHYGTIPIALSVDLTSIDEVTVPTQINADCAQLQADVQAGQKAPAIPLTSIQAQWTTVLSRANAIVLGCETVVRTPTTTAFQSVRSASLALIPVDNALMKNLGTKK